MSNKRVSQGPLGLTLLVLGVFAPLGGAAANDPCDPAAMTQAIQACGLDINCINQANSDFMARCLGAQQPAQPQPPAPSGPGISEGDVQQQIDACGTDLACLSRLMQQLQAGAPAAPVPPSPTPGGGDFELPDPEDTTRRLREQTVLPASWLQTHQDTLVNCGEDTACWSREVTRGAAYAQTYCGSDLMQERTVVCLAAASNEVHIEVAIALQRLWRRGIRVRDPSEPGPPPGDASAQRPEPWGEREAARRAREFTPEVSEGRVRAILDRWRAELGSRLPAEARERVAAAADAFPTRSDPDLPPLIYEVVGERYELKPTRRDWAYAMIGNLLTQAGFLEGGADGELLRDVALWSLIRAAQLTLEPEHLSNVGFHLNLRARLEEARDLLVYASRKAPLHPDVHNNLAFSYSALGDVEQAEWAQYLAYRAAPGDAHIRSRYDAMTPGALPRGPTATTVPPGWDFGEAYFRLVKRHALREYWANKRWSEARMQAVVSTRGGDVSGRKPLGWYANVTKDGPREWYVKRVKDIEQLHDACSDAAPRELHGCPFGAYIDHPSCKDAASPAQVARSIHERKAHLCRCNANRIFELGSAINAYIDNAQAVWKDYEKKWRPVLLGQMARWSSDIRATNARYPDDRFQHPVVTGYMEWIDDFDEDSERFWGRRLPSKLEEWHELKSQAQGLKGCPKRLPPLPPKVEKPKPEKQTTRAYGMELVVVKFELRMDGSFSFGFDLGILKGGYAYNADRRSHAVKVGSGPFEITYEHANPLPGPGAHTHKVSATGSLNFLKLLPGIGRAAGAVADPLVSFGGKYELSWNNATGFDGRPTIEAKPKFGFTNGRTVTVHGYSRLQN